MRELGTVLFWLGDYVHLKRVETSERIFAHRSDVAYSQDALREGTPVTFAVRQNKFVHENEAFQVRLLSVETDDLAQYAKSSNNEVRRLVLPVVLRTLPLVEAVSFVIEEINSLPSQAKKHQFIQSLPKDIEQEVMSYLRAEGDAKQEFVILKAKYFAEKHKDTSPTSPLYMMLLKIDSCEPLDEAEIKWLEKHQLFGTIAHYYQNTYRKERNAWNLVQASSHWRDAHEPERAITLTDYLLNKHEVHDYRLKAAILTTRGGALRDLGNIDLAEQCANDAIQCNSRSFQPYNLLGAIYFERGEPQAGEQCFETALQLGAQPKSQEYQMKQALENAGSVERKTTAQYLLQKDPRRYAWAKYYLKE